MPPRRSKRAKATSKKGVEEELEKKEVVKSPAKKNKFSPRATRSARKGRKPKEVEEEEEEEMEVEPMKKLEKEESSDDDDVEASDSDSDDDDDDDDDDEEDSEDDKEKDQEDDESDSEEEDDDEDEDEDEDEDDDDEVADKGFTDENAKWLKPKKQTNNLLSSDDEDEDEDDDDEMKGDEFDDNASVSSSSTASSLLSIERESKLLDSQIAREKAEGEAEYQHMIKTQTSVYQLPSEDEINSELDGTRVISPSDLRERIQNILEVLSDFKARKTPDKSRSDYTERLSADMAELFGYLPELVDYFLSMLGPHETMQFLEASDSARPVVLRTNTLKTRRKDLAQALLKRGVNLDPLSDWSKVGLKIYESPVPLGATPEYLSGHYMLQSAASMCPVLALSPNINQRVLDMSAAPGGKTSYIAQLMKNTGMILANDLKPERQKATIANMHRLGVKNTVVACHDGRKLGTMYPNSFDRILLDAPCSGLGVISRDPSVKVQRTIADVVRTSHLQKELLLSAVDALNTKKDGGIMVYSTCSVSVAENEEVVDYLLKKRDVKLLDTGLDFGKPGFTRYQQKRFHPSLSLTRRFYPHVHNMDGFYVCKIQKMSHDKFNKDKESSGETKEENENVVDAEKKEVKEKGSKSKDADAEKPGASAPSLKKKKKKGQKKRKRTEEEIKAMEEALANKKNKKQGISKPPSFQQSGKKKNSTNAKVNKPRRKKL